MNNTFEMRKSQVVNTLKTPTDILLEYPRFKDFYHGSLVSISFTS